MFFMYLSAQITIAEASVADVKGQDCEFARPTSRVKVIPTLILNKFILEKKNN